MVVNNCQQLSQQKGLKGPSSLFSLTWQAGLATGKKLSIPLCLHQRSCKTVWCSENFPRRSQNAGFFSWHVAPSKCRSKGARISQAFWLQMFQHLPCEAHRQKKAVQLPTLVAIWVCFLWLASSRSGSSGHSSSRSHSAPDAAVGVP